MGVERNVLTFKARVITFGLQVLYMRHPTHCFKTKVEAAYLTIFSNSVVSAGFCGVALRKSANYYYFIYAMEANYGGYEDVDCLIMFCPISISTISP